MVTTSIVQATEDHAIEILKHVRQADRDELWASTFSTPEDALISGLCESDLVRTGMIDGVPVCMWGVVRSSWLFDKGIPWMIGTDMLDKHAITFIRKCKEPLNEIFGDYDFLENYVDARNTKAVRWLKFMGFNIEKPEKYGMFNLPFHRFWKERENV